MNFFIARRRARFPVCYDFRWQYSIKERTIKRRRGISVSEAASRGTVFLSRLLATTCAATPIAFAGEADTVAADVDCVQQVCSFAVSVRHTDTGWSHFADHWRILDLDGNELGRRVLLHPHENEQPFSRRLADVEIPNGVRRIAIEAHDSVHEYGGQRLEVDIP